MSASGGPRSVVVVGAGHAGFTVASELRAEGYDGRITLLDEHAGLPYQRPPLSKAYLNGDLAADELPFRGAAYYRREGIDHLAEEGAVEISRPEGTVTTSTGRVIGYDALVLATGAAAIHAPFVTEGLLGLHELRTRADADRLNDEMRSATRVLVIGGGFIGLEVACAARKHGVDVHVVELRDRVMSRAVGQTLSRYALDSHRAVGVHFHLGVGVTSIGATRGRVSSVTLDSGESLATDLVVLGLGISPRTELAEKAGLEVENGIMVNEYLETSDPAISAIGDCCSFPYPFGERRIRLESVQNATDQARTVARRLTGHREPYAAVPWFWSDQGGMKLQMAGIGGPADREVLHGDPASGRFSVLRFDGERLVCGESVNSAGDHVSLRTLVAHGADPGLVARLNHPDGEPTALKQLARALRGRA